VLPHTGVVPVTAANVTMKATGSSVGYGLGTALALADVDGDHNDDLFALCERCNINSGSNYSAVLGVKGPILPTTRRSAAQTTPGDFSQFDLAVFGTNSNRGAQWVAGGDVTGDGRAELFFSVQTSSSGIREVHEFKGRADFWTSLPGGTRVSTIASSDLKFTTGTSGDFLGQHLAVADIDGDHVGDLVLAAPSSGSSLGHGTVFVFWGASAAVSGATPVAVSTAPLKVQAAAGRSLGYGLGVGDFNDDGHADLVMAGDNGSTPGSVYVLLGGTRP
jgi:hypothetical protein